MDPRVEMVFFTLFTFPAENLNTGETEACLGNCSFSRVSFLACTYARKKMKGTEDQSHHLTKTDRYHALTILWVPAISRGVPWASRPSVKE